MLLLGEGLSSRGRIGKVLNTVGSLIWSSFRISCRAWALSPVGGVFEPCVCHRSRLYTASHSARCVQQLASDMRYT